MDSKQKPPFVMPEGVRLVEDLVYGTGGGRDLHLNLFLPDEEAPPRPGIVFVHGGGWRLGDWTYFQRQAAYMAERGFVGACIAYRLAGEALFPAAVEDAKCAVRWMRSVAGEYGVDPDRIAAVGGSAGAHLAAMLGTTDAPTGLEGEGGYADHSSRVNAFASYNGVFDLVAVGNGGAPEEDHLRWVISNFLGGLCEEMPQTYALASPMVHVDEFAAPSLLMHGTADQAVSFEQSALFQKKLQEAGAHSELAAYEGAGHSFGNKPPFFEPALERMSGFLHRVLRHSQE